MPQFVDMRLAAAQGPLHLEDDIGLAERRGGRRNRSAGLGIGGIGKKRAAAGAAFGDDVEPHRDHAPDGVGRRRNPAFKRPPFLDDGNLHRAAVPGWPDRWAVHNAAPARFVKSEPGEERTRRGANRANPAERAVPRARRPGRMQAGISAAEPKSPFRCWLARAIGVRRGSLWWVAAGGEGRRFGI